MVSAGANGIGLEIARAFVREGARVHVCDVDAAAVAKLAKSDPALTSTVCDVSNRDQVTLFFEQGLAKLGGLDCLVNNAGVWIHNPMSQFDEERFLQTMRINVRGPFLCLQHALPFLRMSKEASVVNIASTSGQRGEAYYSPYSASKGAVISATKAWALELAPEIRVNCVAPGWVDTEMCEEPFAEGGRAEIEAGIPLGRVASPEDIAGPIHFLASPLARHLPGEILNVNGGSVLCG